MDSTVNTSRRNRPESKLETSQTARATLALREMLCQGRFRPGERLREVPLAQELGVSRVPLRLALERLAHEGFLEMRATRGFVAQQFELDDIRETIDLRGVIEGMAARLAAERLGNPAELQAMRTLHREMDALVRRRRLTLESVEIYIDRNARFHEELLRLSGSRRVRRAMEQLCSLPFASPNAFLQRQYLAPESQDLFLISVEHHRAILEAIEHGEGARAEALAREHARVSRRNLEMALENRALGETVPALKLIRL
jgi:GntR family transcriptional regulator of vanillate catabolism